MGKLKWFLIGVAMFLALSYSAYGEKSRTYPFRFCFDNRTELLVAFTVEHFGVDDWSPTAIFYIAPKTRHTVAKPYQPGIYKVTSTTLGAEASEPQTVEVTPTKPGTIIVFTIKRRVKINL